jgi:ATP-dependent exoDNAse (exonuclease V) beta subunit
VDDGDSFPVFDSEYQKWRSPRSSDLAILIPTRTHLPRLTSALSARGVEFTVVGAGAAELDEVRKILLALAHPADAQAVAAALMTTLMDVCDEELLAWRRSGGQFLIPLSAKAGLPSHRRAPASSSDSAPLDENEIKGVEGSDTEQPDLSPVRHALARLYRLAVMARRCRPLDVLEQVLLEFEVERVGMLHGDPDGLRAQLLSLRERAAKFQSDVDGGLADLVSYLDMNPADAPVGPTPGQGVTITTVHGAKGLEYPIVIMAQMANNHLASHLGAEILVGPAGLEFSLKRKVIETSGFAELYEQEESFRDAEAVRLAYVAATRARDHLIISAYHQPEKAATLACRIHAAAMVTPHLWSAHAGPPIAPPDGPDKEDARAQSGEQSTSSDPQQPDVVLSGQWLWPSDSEELEQARAAFQSKRAALLAGIRAKVPVRVRPSDQSAEIERWASPVDAATRPNREIATAVGRAVHSCLQAIDLACRPDRAHLSQLARAQADHGGVPEAAEEIASLTLSALASDLLVEAAGREHYKEVPITVLVDGRLIDGQIDLVIKRPSGLVVIDFKTDVAGLDSPWLPAHEEQVRQYARALSAAGHAVKEGWLLLCRSDGRPADCLSVSLSDAPQ